MPTDPLEALREAALLDPEIPAAVRGFLGSGAALQSLCLNPLGQWRFEGGPVEHPRVVALFNRSLQRTSAGTWVLTIPPFTYPVLVEGVGWFITRLGFDSDGWFGITTGAERVLLADAVLVTDGARFLGAQVGGRLYRFIRSAHHDLLAEVDVDETGQWSTSTPAGPRILSLIDESAKGDAGPAD